MAQITKRVYLTINQVSTGDYVGSVSLLKGKNLSQTEISSVLTRYQDDTKITGVIAAFANAFGEVTIIAHTSGF